MYKTIVNGQLTEIMNHLLLFSPMKDEMRADCELAELLLCMALALGPLASKERQLDTLLSLHECYTFSLPEEHGRTKTKVAWLSAISREGILRG